MPEAQEFWENHYGAKTRVWSGRVNLRLAEVAGSLSPGRALDLGCGEGADALWLADRGWRVVAVDISQTALQRATGDARAAGLLERIDFQRHDLSDSFPAGTFDLVSAQFLHSPVHLDRDEVLRRAAAAVAPSGLLLVVDHASAPPWAWNLGHEHHFPTAEEVVSALSLNSTSWQSLRAEAVERQATGPDGQIATVTDNVIVLRRVGGD